MQSQKLIPAYSYDFKFLKGVHSPVILEIYNWQFDEEPEITTFYGYDASEAFLNLKDIGNDKEKEQQYLEFMVNEYCPIDR